MSRRLRGGVTDDDHEGFGRPGRGSRPRTKDSPDYSDAAEAIVVTIDRGRYRCLHEGVPLTATKAPAHRLHQNNSGATPHLASIGG